MGSWLWVLSMLIMQVNTNIGCSNVGAELEGVTSVADHYTSGNCTEAKRKIIWRIFSYLGQVRDENSQLLTWV